MDQKRPFKILEPARQTTLSQTPLGLAANCEFSRPTILPSDHIAICPAGRG